MNLRVPQYFDNKDETLRVNRADDKDRLWT